MDFSIQVSKSVRLMNPNDIIPETYNSLSTNLKENESFEKKIDSDDDETNLIASSFHLECSIVPSDCHRVSQSISELCSYRHALRWWDIS